MVELSRTLGGPVEDSYAVQDKTQEAEVDPGMIVEDELFAVETWEPCLVCGSAQDGHGIMYCDGCDRAVHVFCAGFDDAPDVWYCETCLVDLENDTELPGMASALQRRPRRQQNRNGAQPRRRRNNDAVWARVWQEVSRRLDLDLDFPFDDEGAAEQRTEEQRREFQRWQERFAMADSHGASDRLRSIARARLGREPTPNPESQDELRAWNAFDKARESQDAPTTVRRRKRRRTESPASQAEAGQSEQPQLKRPRLRRPPPTQTEQAESSNAAAGRRNTEEPTFLSSLLREVENKATSAASPATSDHVHGQQSPRNSSPARSPASSECGSPRAAVTPPPQRPLSPPLSSELVPVASPVTQTFSPFSPAETGITLEKPPDATQRGRRRRNRERQQEQEGVTSEGRQSSASPSRLSYSAKEEIQRMVKLSLGARYREKEITKDQYTDINRDVSRKMYDLVGDASALAGQEERERWQNVANEEVQKAIAALPSSGPSDEE